VPTDRESFIADSEGQSACSLASTVSFLFSSASRKNPVRTASAVPLFHASRPPRQVSLSLHALVHLSSIMSFPNENERPLSSPNYPKPGVTDRARHHLLSRTNLASRPCSHKGVLFSKRVNNEQVVASFVKDDKVIPCCANACCAKLLGSHAELFSSCPGPEESMQRLAFVNSVVATRTHIHEKGQLESGKRLLARLRLGFSEGTRALPFAKSYSFPGQRGASGQEYWWRTEDEACVQVSCNSPIE